MEQKKDFSFRLTTREGLGEFMDAFEGFRSERDLDYKVYFDLKICLEEIIINIFKHGGGGRERDLRVNVLLVQQNDGTIVSEITDNAIPFNIVEMNSGVDFESELEDRPIGGVGIHLVKNLADSLEYEQLKDGNKVTLSKKTVSA